MSYFPVCQDIDGTSTWFYDDVTQKYMRCDSDGVPDKVKGKILARLHGRDIPDPEKLHTTRLRRLEAAAANGARITPKEKAQAKPSPTTYALWRHWQEVNNAKPNT